MSRSEDDGRMEPFEVGVAIASAADADAGDSQRGGALPGFDEAAGLKLPGRHGVDQSPVLIVKGEEAVRIATEAIAEQIGVAARRIATSIEAQVLTERELGELTLESVEVSFGITLAAGMQALFTAKAESSAQVNITLARHPTAGS